MIIYSIIPIEDIFDMNKWTPQNQVQRVRFNGVDAEVLLVENNICEIQRIYSTNPKDYLKPGLQPGTKLKMHYKTRDEE